MLYTSLGDILFWALVVFGLTYLGVAAAIFSRPRRWLYDRLPRGVKGVLACAPCFSVWVGAVLGAVGFVPMPWTLPAWSWGVIFLRAVIGGVISVGLVAGFQFAAKIFVAEIVDGEAEKGEAGPQETAGEEAEDS